MQCFLNMQLLDTFVIFCVTVVIKQYNIYCEGFHFDHITYYILENLSKAVNFHSVVSWFFPKDDNFRGVTEL